MDPLLVKVASLTRPLTVICLDSLVLSFFLLISLRRQYCMTFDLHGTPEKNKSPTTDTNPLTPDSAAVSSTFRCMADSPSTVWCGWNHAGRRAQESRPACPAPWGPCLDKALAGYPLNPTGSSEQPTINQLSQSRDQLELLELTAKGKTVTSSGTKEVGRLRAIP
jgi:hypothetical protein